MHLLDYDDDSAIKIDCTSNKYWALPITCLSILPNNPHFDVNLQREPNAALYNALRKKSTHLQMRSFGAMYTNFNSDIIIMLHYIEIVRMRENAV